MLIVLIGKTYAIGYKLMYADRVNEIGNVMVWGIKGISSSTCCEAVKLFDTGDSHLQLQGYYVDNMPTDIISSSAWVGNTDIRTYESILQVDYTSESNVFKLHHSTQRSAHRYIAWGYSDISECSQIYKYNLTALWFNNVNSNIIYGCVNPSTGEYKELHHFEDKYSLNDDEGFIWEYGGGFYNDKLNLLWSTWWNEATLSVVVIQINVNGSNFVEFKLVENFELVGRDCHYSQSTSTNEIYPCVGWLQYNYYDVNLRRFVEPNIVHPPAGFLTLVPYMKTTNAIIMDRQWNIYMIDMQNGNYTLLGKVSGDGIGHPHFPKGKLWSFWG